MSRQDEGSILPLVLVVTVVLAAVVVALATYATATLRYGAVTEASAQRLASAQGGLENALERIRRGESPCVTETIQTGGSVSYDMVSAINGIRPTVTCTVFSGDITAIDAHAVILTGHNGQTGPLLTITEAAAATKIFKGNVYMDAVPVAGNGAGNHTIELGSNLSIQNGTIKYHPDSTRGQTCTTPVDLDANSKSVTLGAGYLIPQPPDEPANCDPSEDWTRFRVLQPLEPSFASAPPRTGPVGITTAGCTVWEPGIYTAAPALAGDSYNYFRSGEYFFDDIGTWTISNAFVLAGWPGAAGPDIENNRIDNGTGRPDGSVNGNTNPCNSEWTRADQAAAGTGAAFYLGGDSNVVVGANGSLEITGFARDGYSIGVYASESGGTASSVGGDETVLSTDPGNKKQLSVRGLIWAPGAGVEFSNVANETVAVLTGGAVISELSAGASANASNFTIGVETTPQQSSIVVDSTATNSGTTTIRAQLLYRTNGTTNDYAVLSRRVLDLAPE